MKTNISLGQTFQIIRLLLLAGVLAFMNACDVQDTIDAHEKDTVEDVDLFLLRLNDVYNHISALKQNDDGIFESKVQELRFLVNSNKSADQIFLFLDVEFGIDAQKIEELQSLAQKSNRYISQKGIIDTNNFLAGRMEILSRKGLTTYRPLKKSCGWIAFSGIAKAAGAFVGGCIGGPLGCGIGGGLAVIQIIDTTIELCETCGCDN